MARQMKIPTQPTIYGAVIDTCLRFRLPYLPEPYWTINERYNVHHNTVVPSTAELRYNWFCVGIGGTDTIKNTGGLSKRIENPMRTEDSGLYTPTPFLVRPIANDLTPSERLAMGLSGRYKVTGAGNVELWGYFLKKFVVPNVMPKAKKLTVVDGVTTIEDLVTTSTNNAPIPPLIPVGQANSTNGIFFSPSLPLDLSLTDAEYSEYQAATETIYGETGYGYISEAGIVAGYEATVPLLNAALEPISGTYTEVLRATITNRLELDVGVSGSGFELILDCAAAIPQFGITATENP